MLKYRHIAAQILALGIWTLSFVRIPPSAAGAVWPEGPVGGFLIIVFFVSGIPALIIGLLDGLLFESSNRIVRIILFILLMVLAWWTANAMLLVGLNLETAPSLGTRLLGLTGIEITLMMELGFAFLIFRLRRKYG